MNRASGTEEIFDKIIDKMVINAPNVFEMAQANSWLRILSECPYQFSGPTYKED